MKKRIVIIDLDKQQIKNYLVQREHKKLNEKGIAHIYKGKMY